MKACFLAIAALAVSAFAAPAVDSSKAVRAAQVNQAVSQLEEVVEELGVGQIVDDATSGAGGASGLKAREITSAGGVINLLKGLKSNVITHTGLINETLSKVQGGKLTKAQGIAQVSKQVSAIHFKLTDIVTELTDAASLTVQPGQVDTVLTLVVAVLSEVLATVKSIVLITGLTPQLTSLLHSVFSILAEVLTLLLGLLTALLPGLVAALSPLLAGLGNGLLAPLLTPIVALLASISLP